MKNLAAGNGMVRNALMATLVLAMASYADFEQDTLFVNRDHGKVEKDAYMTLIDEALMPGSVVFRYPYPATPPPGMVDDQAYSGRSSMQLILTPKAWSGFSGCWGGGGRDMTKIRKTGAIEFWVKGSKCDKAQCWGPFEIGLMDNGRYSGGQQLRAYVNASKYGIITDSTWTHFVIPLKDLGFEGSYWNNALNAKVQGIFNWESVACFTIDDADNNIPYFGLYFDKVRILEKINKN